MKYTTECVIEKPLQDVIAVFEDTEKLMNWQRGLLSSTLIRGKQGEVGSKRRLKIVIEGRIITMIEKITFKDLPNAWHGKYTSKGIESTQQNYFTSIEESKTHWVAKSNFKFSGWMILVSKVLPHIFEERSKLVMKDFKNFVENGIRVG